MLDLVLPRKRRGQKLIGAVYTFLGTPRKAYMTAKERRRANRRMKHQREALLEMKNMYGNKDLTAYNAVLQIRTNGKADIRLK
jgi:hypothetical protein